MRTLIFIVSGLILLAICLAVAKFAAGGTAPAMTWAVRIFAVLWFIIAAVNMWIGISQAGYSFMEELPIFLLLFGLPVAVAVLLRWKVL